MHLPRRFLGPVLGRLLLLPAFVGLGCECRRPEPPGPSVPHTAPGRDEPGPSAAEQALREGLDALRAESREPLDIGMDRDTIRHAAFDVEAPPEHAGNPDAVALWFLREHPRLLGVARPERDFELTRRSPDGRHLFFRQLHDGIPVFPAEIVVHTDGSRVTGFDGGHLPDFVDDGQPLIEPREAEVRAAAHVGNPSLQPIADTRLRYVDLGLAGDPGATRHLSHRVVLPSAQVFVDARSGEIVHVESSADHELDLDIETAHGDVSDSCWIFTSSDEQWFDEDGVVSGARPDAEGWAADANARRIYQFFLDRLGRDSYDGDEEDIEIYLDVGLARFGGGANASYEARCDIFEFTDNMSALDVMAHEYGHGVIATSADFSDASQPDALDESFADIFSYAVDASNWQIGESTPQGPTRDLTISVRKHWREYLHGDSGHNNSTINTYTRYLLQNGQQKSDASHWPVEKIPPELIDALYYRALVNRLTESSTFMDVRNAVVAEAQALSAEVGHKGLPCAAQNAYTNIGLGIGDRDCDGTLDYLDTNQDGDYRIDTEDNCPRTYNPAQSDQDGDGEGDACDTDIDGDGHLNDADNCPRVKNADQKNDHGGSDRGDACDDGDGDGIMDDKDVCPGVPDPRQTNTDGTNGGDACDDDDDDDQVLDDRDNCPLVRNTDQADEDRDDIGDACDLCPNFPDENNIDTDGDNMGDACDNDDDDDGVRDDRDNCPLVRNRDQFDGDDNGIGMACDSEEQRRWVQDRANRAPVEVNSKPGGPGVTKIPIPVCCVEGPLPRGSRLTLDIELTASARVRVVDGDGRTVTSERVAADAHRLRFRPAANANAPSVEAGARAWRSHAAPRYFLEVWSPPEHEVGIAVRARLGTK